MTGGKVTAQGGVLMGERLPFEALPPRDCVVCGASFRPVRRRRKTCTDRCRGELLRWLEGGARALRRKIAERTLETARMQAVLDELEGDVLGRKP